MKIKLSKSDLQNPAVIAALGVLLLSMAGEKVSPVINNGMGENAPSPVEEKKPKATKETFPDKEPTTLEKVAEQITDGPAAEDNEDIPKLEDLREVLGKKVTDHREAIKAELTKRNAKNVTLLGKEHYVEFLAFLNGL